MENTQLLDYAVAQFQQGNYDVALEAFILAYCRGYEQEWVIQNIYSCYMSGNDEAFRTAYERYATDLGIVYEDCILDFVPYRDGEYQIFDKEAGIFWGVFSVRELENTEMAEALRQSEYSASAFMLNWNWRERLDVLVAAKERKCYVISSDMRRICSFFKLPELETYMQNVKVFSDLQQFQDYFHENTSVYLPHIVFGKQEEMEAMLKVIKEEHQYRLTPEGRNTENVLLTIGIPTHDRGNLLLDRINNLCKMSYDAEIEFAVSKHGTHYYQDEYKSVEAMRDARINYVGCDVELGMSGNWQNVVKIAHGKFVLLVSDEDDVILEALEHYLKLLSDHETLGFVRSRSVVQASCFNIDQYHVKGKNAFEQGFLRQNYLSGIICNKRMFEEADLKQYDLKYKDNDFFRFYPHMWWQVVLSFKGDYAVDSMCLIWEGDSVSKEETQKRVQDGLIVTGTVTKKNLEIDENLSSYQARLKQFRGMVELIKDCEEFDDELRKIAVFQAISKTYYLMDMYRAICEDSEEEFAAWIERLIEEVMAVLQELQIKPKDQQLILFNIMSWINKTRETERW